MHSRAPCNPAPSGELLRMRCSLVKAYMSKRFITSMIIYARKEILKPLVVNCSPLGVVLHGEREWIIPQPHLLDNVVGSAPRFDFETVRNPIDRLMVRTVYFFESMIRSRIVTQRLNITVFLVGVLVTRNIELKRATERDIQNLDASANAEDRQTARERF